MKYYLGDANGNPVKEISAIDAMKEAEKRGVSFQFLDLNTFRCVIKEDPREV